MATFDSFILVIFSPLEMVNNIIMNRISCPYLKSFYLKFHQTFCDYFALLSIRQQVIRHHGENRIMANFNEKLT